MKIIGIDCGLSGAITVIEKSKIIEKIVMPVIKITKTKHDYDIPAIITFLNNYPEANIIIEKTQALPGKGVVQMFKLGRGYGIIIGIVAALKYPYFLVHPKTWQTKMFRDVNKDNTKLASIYVAKRLFPNENFKATSRCKKDHDGLTDSALIAYYGEQYL